MVPLHSPKDYLFNLYATKSGEAKRIWRNHIKEQWNHQCAYCGSNEKLTLDHIIPQSKGGPDVTENIVCCCYYCNQSKGHSYWEDWYEMQDFYNEFRRKKIIDWIKPNKSEGLYSYRPRRNNAS